MITVIITAYKEPQTIGKAITQVIKNKIKEKYEVLVFAPDIETIDAAKKFAKQNKNVRVIQDKGKGKPAALNIALKKAKGEILVLTDGDVYTNENSINKLISFFKDSKIGAVSGHPISLESRKNKFGYWSHLLTDMVDLWRRKSKFISCSGYLYAVRKNVLSKMPEETLSDDAYNSHIVAEKGYKIAYSPDSFVYIKYPTNFSDWIKQKKRSAGGYNQLKYLLSKKSNDRNIFRESSGIFQVLNYPKNFKEFFWTIQLILARIYLWAIIFIDINVKKKDFRKIWVRIESTK
ncbi:glycosyltransferase [Candidatus Pacearchaeota archaeon]|nr:glycosyltransferase [Candidatus Pacearchaeota archaeon]